MKSRYALKAAFLAVSLAVVGCGGGGGESSEAPKTPTTGTTPTTPTTAPTTPTTPAAPVVTVSTSELNIIAGQSADFLITVTDDKGLTSSTLGCDDGLSLSISNILSGNPTSYQVTPTITAANHAIDTTGMCKVAFGDADSNTGVAEITVNITGVNIVPEVSAGEDLEADSGQSVQLSATATDTNFNGGIASYHWRQTAGADLEVNGADSRNLSFTAPRVPKTQVFTFEVTATDVHGAKASDSVNVEVKAFQSANVNVLFPLQGGTTDVAANSELSVIGNVETYTDSKVESIRLSHGAKVVDIPVASDGNWKGAIELEAGEDIEVKINATNSDGYVFEDTLKLNRTLDISGSQEVDIEDAVGSALDAKNNILYLQTSGFLVSDIKVYAFDLTTQKFTQVNFADQNLTQDDLSKRPTDIELDTSKNILYTSNRNSIFATDLATNKRAKLNVNFEQISDFDLDIKNNKLFLADNSAAKAAMVDLSTEKQSYFEVSSDIDMAGILSMNYLSSNNSLVISKAFNFGKGPLFSYDLNQAQPSPSYVVKRDSQVVKTGTFELAFTEDGSKAYFIDESGDLKVVTMATQQVETLKEDIARVNVLFSIERAAVELDEEKGLLYVFGEKSNRPAIMIIDIQSNTMVTKLI